MSRGYYREAERAIARRLHDHYGFAPLASEIKIVEEGEDSITFEVGGVRYKLYENVIYLIGRN